MAMPISSQFLIIVEKLQHIHEDMLALQAVVRLAIDSASFTARSDDFLYLVDRMVTPLSDEIDTLNCLVRSINHG